MDSEDDFEMLAKKHRFGNPADKKTLMDYSKAYVPQTLQLLMFGQKVLSKNGLKQETSTTMNTLIINVKRMPFKVQMQPRWCLTQWVASECEWALPLALANGCSRMTYAGCPFRSCLRQS